MGSENGQGPGRHLPVFQALLITLGRVFTTDILKTAQTVALNVGPEYSSVTVVG